MKPVTVQEVPDVRFDADVVGGGSAVGDGVDAVGEVVAVEAPAAGGAGSEGISSPVDNDDPGAAAIPPDRGGAVAVAPGAGLTRDELNAVLAAGGWPEALWDEAARVAWCESGWRPGVTNGSSRGLFQLNGRLWFDYAKEDPDGWADPVVNARTAYATYGYDIARGYAPWSQWECRP